MKQSIKFIAGLLVFLALSAAATLAIIKYFDIIASLALDLKEKIQAKKTALFSTTCCADDDEDCEFAFDMSFDEEEATEV